MTTDPKDPKQKKLNLTSKVFSYRDLRECVRYYETFACAIPGEIEQEQIELVRGWIEEYRPHIFRKLFPKKKGATHA